jgi:DNA-binding GntR family transcriptional regulator
MDLTPHRALFEAAMSRDGAAAKAELATHAQLSLQAFTDLMDLIPDETPLAAVLRQTPQEPRP